MPYQSLELHLSLFRSIGFGYFNVKIILLLTQGCKRYSTRNPLACTGGVGKKKRMNKTDIKLLNDFYFVF